MTVMQLGLLMGLLTAGAEAISEFFLTFMTLFLMIGYLAQP